MPHRCMNCGREYSEDSDELIEGCECGSSLFLFQQEDEEAQDVEKLQEERDEVLDEIDQFLEQMDEDGEEAHKNTTKISFDLQSIRVIEEGVYEIDVKQLLKRVPLVVEIMDSGYYVHLPSVFKKGEDKNLSFRDMEKSEKLR
ncbi:MAG: Zn-ribbon containing protein [Candidatus Nanohaloarchaea archaeon]|nr:Zn-ribbon containing protein [Candidatus Nanohaloarchaea archaeon]